jgi:hypothetical protein
MPCAAQRICDNSALVSGIGEKVRTVLRVAKDWVNGIPPETLGAGNATRLGAGGAVAAEFWATTPGSQKATMRQSKKYLRIAFSLANRSS